MYDEAYTKLLQMVGTGDAPDMMQMGKVRETVDAGMITPMQDFIDKDDDFDIESLLPVLRASYEVDGTMQYMPQSASTNVVFYNVDAFKKAGLDPDKPLETFEDFTNASRTLKENLDLDYGAAFLIDGGEFQTLMGLQGQPIFNNGNGREAAPTEAVYNSESGVATMTWIKELYDEGLTGNYGRSFDDMRQPWYTGQIAMIVDTTAATIMHTQSADFAFDSMPPPVPKVGSTGGPAPGGNGLVIFADSPEETQQAAYKFVRFLVSPEIQARWSANTGYFPVVEDALDDPTLVEAMEKIPALASANDQALSAGDDPNGLTPLSGVSASTPLADAWEEVYADGDPKQVLDKSAAEVTAQLKTYNEANPS
jgi:sn-glycerol 3-phosphate transport system substrate-binding protein